MKQSVVMMIDCGIKANKFNLEDLSEALLGNIGYYLAIVPMFLFAYGGQIAYLVIVGDTVPLVANYISPHGDSIFHNREVIVTLFSVIIILPLCLLRDLSHLAWTSSLSILSDVILIIVIFGASIAASKEQQDHFETHDLSELNTTLFAGVGTMSFAFVCQHNSFLVFKSLKSPTLREWDKVANISISVSYCLSLMLGLIGFFAFYPYVEGDLLNNFPSNYASVCIARALLASTMIFTYPMECYVSRHCLYSLVTRKLQVSTTDGYSDSVHSNRQLLSSEDSSHHLDVSKQHKSQESSNWDVESPSASVIKRRNHSKKEYEMVQRRDSNNHRHNQLQDEEEEEEEIVFNALGRNSTDNESQFELSHLSDIDLSEAMHSSPSASRSIPTTELQSVSKPHVEEGFSKFWHLTCTLFLWGSTLMIALVAKKLGVVSALTGKKHKLLYINPALWIYILCNTFHN